MLIVIGSRPDVIVPDVRGRDEEDALRALADAGLGTARRVMRRSDSVPEGHIVRTRPRAGAEVPTGSRVSYVVGVGPRESAGHRRGDRHRVRARRLPDGTFISLPE
jgi:serine/threonine-protein kinase